MSARWGQARIEVAALRDEVLDGLKDGAPIKRVYDDLKKDGRLTISLKVFYKWVKRFRAETLTQSPQFNSLKASRSAHTPQQSSRDRTPSRGLATASIPIARQSQANPNERSPVIGSDVNGLTDMTSASFEETWAGQATDRNKDNGTD